MTEIVRCSRRCNIAISLNGWVVSAIALFSTVILAVPRGRVKMGILDLFRKDKDAIHGAKVLVCALDNRFDDLLKGDSEVYGRYYRATTAAVLPGIQALVGRLEQRYDIVHLLCDVTANGTITDANGEEITGTELIQRCCDVDVKLLWSGSDNPQPQRHTNGGHHPARDDCRKIPSLTMSAVSSTFRTHVCMHSRKSAISLYQKKCHAQPRLAS
jgi:hypothetical protein